MRDEQEAQRIARTESLFREVNERIAESAQRFESDDAQFICECADPACTTRVEAVVEQESGHAVVQKRDPHVRPIVLALDPRAA